MVLTCLGRRAVAGGFHYPFAFRFFTSVGTKQMLIHVLFVLQASGGVHACRRAEVHIFFLSVYRRIFAVLSWTLFLLPPTQFWVFCPPSQIYLFLFPGIRPWKGRFYVIHPVSSLGCRFITILTLKLCTLVEFWGFG